MKSIKYKGSLAIKMGLYGCLLQSLSITANADQLTVATGFASTNLSHGIALSVDEPITHFSMSYDFAEKYYSGIDIIYGKKSPAPILTQGLSVYFGLFQIIEEDKAIDLSVTQHLYRGEFEYDWDYSILDLTYHHNRSTSISIQYSDDYYGRGYSSSFIGLHWQSKLTEKGYFFLGGGRTFYSGVPFYLQQYLPAAITNTESGFGYDIERWNLQLKYSHVDQTAKDIHGKDAVGNQLQFTVIFSIY